MWSTVQLARRGGCSAQHVRDLEREKVIPPATRAPNGYRGFTEIHLDALVAYLALRDAVGSKDARSLARSTRTAPPTTVLARIDAFHARLHAERQGLQHARSAVPAIATEAIDTPRPEDLMTIGELAAALDVRTSTLRHWESEGLVSPHRSGAAGARVYSPDDVRDARIVDQLRRAGYDIPRLRSLMSRLRDAAADRAVDEALAARERQIDARTRALLRAGTALDRILDDPA